MKPNPVAGFRGVDPIGRVLFPFCLVFWVGSLDFVLTFWKIEGFPLKPQKANFCRGLNRNQVSIIRICFDSSAIRPRLRQARQSDRVSGPCTMGGKWRGGRAREDFARELAKPGYSLLSPSFF